MSYYIQECMRACIAFFLSLEREADYNKIGVEFFLLYLVLPGAAFFLRAPSNELFSWFISSRPGEGQEGQ
jgi:hypothetical protein